MRVPVLGLTLACALLLGGCATLTDPTADATAPARLDATEWEEVFFDDFTRTSLGSNWSRYTGQPSSDPRTRWDASRVTLSGGSLVLSGVPRNDGSGNWLTGGVSNWQQARTYGRWDIRFRALRSDVLSYHLLLWPQSENWPPEIDIAEGFRADRSLNEAFIHWRNAAGARERAHFSVAGDFTTWHTVSVEWSEDEVRFLLDDVEYGSVTGAAVPHEPMFLALQTETQVGGSRAGSTDRIEVDWVRISQRSTAQAVPECSELVTAAEIYEFQPLYAAVPAAAPLPARLDAVARASGRACAWEHETRGTRLWVGAARPGQSALATAQADARALSAARSVTVGGAPATVHSGKRDGAYEAEVFTNDTWIVLRESAPLDDQTIRFLAERVLDGL